MHLWLQEWAHQELRDGFQLGFFPLTGAGACLFCTLVMVVDSQRARIEEDLERIGWLDWLLAPVVLVLLYLFYQAAWTFGFALVAPVFLAAATYALGARPWWTAAVSGVATTLTISIAFWVIGIDLPLPFFL